MTDKRMAFLSGKYCPGFFRRKKAADECDDIDNNQQQDEDFYRIKDKKIESIP
jgi:hypothetical protein